MTTRRPRLYFSLRSPYSWLAMHRLRAEVAELDTHVELIPYWDPDARTSALLADRGGEFHYVQMSRAKHLYMLLDTKRLAQRDGLAMAWPVDIDVCWERPHLAWLEAQRAGRGWAFYDAITTARWGRGEDIGTEATVAAAAEQAGLDPVVALGAVDDPAVRAEGVECLYRGYLDDIFGIPYLKWGRHRFWGLDRVDAFLATWRPPADGPQMDPTPRVPAAVLAMARPYDLDSAGGCG